VPSQRRPDRRPPKHTNKASLPNTPSRPGKSFQDGATGDAAVANHIYSVAPRPVELTPAMIGHHDGGRADVHGTLRVRNAHDALETELLSPFPADLAMRKCSSFESSLGGDNGMAYPLSRLPRPGDDPRQFRRTSASPLSGQMNVNIAAAHHSRPQNVSDWQHKIAFQPP
jgi:hypothetical protein